MAKYLKLFEQYTQYETYINGQNAIKPNVSYCEDVGGVYYNPFVAPMNIITYEATSKLVETTSDKNNGLHTNAFNCAIVSHTFENGVGTVEFESDVTSIGNYAFYGCSGLTSIDIPSDVTEIGSQAFYNCSGLTSIDIPSGVTSIGSSAFSGCTGLTSIDIPSSVTSIGNNAFQGCINIEILNYDAQVRLSSSFKGWGTALKTVVIGDSTPSIGTNAFSGCDGLTSVTIGNGVTFIDSNAFYNCSGLTSINIPNSVNHIFEQVFFNCTSLSTITIPNSVMYIGKQAFENTLWFNSQPNGVVYINSIAYKYKGAMPSQTSIEIPSGVTRINDLCFSDCENLSSITIPSSVTSIGDLAFAGCTNLGTITSFAITAPTIIPNNFDTGNGTFIGMYSGTLYVPIGSSGYDTWMNNLPSSWTKVEQ